MPRPKTSGNGRLRALECPTDGMIVYCSRGAVIRHGLPHCACGDRMYFRDLQEMLEHCPEQAHEHPDFAAYTAAYVRQTVRDTSHVPASRFQCGGCRQFIRATNERCGCGFHNDIRGNLNHGRYVAGSSRVNADMPF